MSFARCAILLLCLVLTGCQPGSQQTGDEQKEPYFMAAKKRLQERDIQGAIDSFEKALDVNPRSASAHIELGILYEQHQNDWPAGLYHYSRALQLRPDYPSADVIKQHIEYCKRELAKSVVQLPSVEALQRKVDTLSAENAELKKYLQIWQAYYRTNSVPQPTYSPPRAQSPAPSVTNQVPRELTSPPSARPSPAQSRSPAPARAHTVVSGETIEKIARRYGVSVNTVLSANPTVDPRRIRPGQSLVIPPANRP